MVITMVGSGRGRGPQEVLLASLVAIFDIALGVANCVVWWCLLVTAQDCILACLCGAVHEHLLVGGVLGGDALRLPDSSPKEVALSTSPRALLVVSGQPN
jgi:hypothetical protein